VITADLLTRIPLFAGVPEHERGVLAARAADVRLGAQEWLLLEGQSPAFFAVLEGSLDVFKSIGGREQRLATYREGDYFGEVPLLLGAPALASVQAVEPSRLMRLEPNDFHEIVSECRVLNSEIMKTMATRVGIVQQRVIDTPAIQATLIGHRYDIACVDLRDFLSRNRVPFAWQDLDDSDCVERLVDDGLLEPGPRAGEIDARSLGASRLPLLVLLDGTRLEAPTYREAARALGFQTEPTTDTYDVVIVGGGPAGLAAAVYAASEGLCTMLVERLACGGQASSSSRIENYLGFPAGLSGDELSGRARQQALRFGAELLVARSVTDIELNDASASPSGPHTVVLDDGIRVAASTIILATGVQWRRLDVPGIDRLAGHGVFYGAARSEALSVRGRHVHLVGGGNSAGQAAMLFSSYADSVTLLVRGPTLAASMSHYLIDQLASKDNITVETDVEVVGVHGEYALEAIEIEHRRTGRRERRSSGGLFVFIGARAETSWLPDPVIRDQWGYVCTGRDVMDLLRERTSATWPLERDPFLLETSVPGIFAAGDVRHASIKRVASGVGEGSMSVAFVHQYLAEVRPTMVAH
jgi:thioredoxin reductase (NADPH)